MHILITLDSPIRELELGEQFPKGCSEVSAGLGSEPAPDFKDSPERLTAAFFCLRGLAGCWLVDVLLTKRVMWFGQNLNLLCLLVPFRTATDPGGYLGTILRKSGVEPRLSGPLPSFPVCEPKQVLSFTGGPSHLHTSREREFV